MTLESLSVISGGNGQMPLASPIIKTFRIPTSHSSPFRRDGKICLRYVHVGRGSIANSGLYTKAYFLPPRIPRLGSSPAETYGQDTWSVDSSRTWPQWLVQTPIFVARKAGDKQATGFLRSQIRNVCCNSRVGPVRSKTKLLQQLCSYSAGLPRDSPQRCDVVGRLVGSSTSSPYSSVAGLFRSHGRTCNRHRESTLTTFEQAK